SFNALEDQLQVQDVPTTTRSVIERTMKGRATRPRSLFEACGRVGDPRGIAASGRFGGVLGVDPVPFELLIARGLEQGALVAGLPADDLVGLAAFVAALLPAGRPGAVGFRGRASLLVEVVRLALAVRLH